MVTIPGGIGNDTLVSQVTDDLLVGGAGNDVYRFTSGTGFDTIDDTASGFGIGQGGADEIAFDGSVTAGAVRLARSSLFSNDLLISVVNANGARIASITVDDHFLGGNGVIEGLRIGGVLQDISAGLTVQGIVNQSSLAGSAFADTLVAGSWNETFYGGAGNDIYRFSAGFGFDTISDGLSVAGFGGTEEILFDASISAASVRLARAGLFSDDLLIRVVDANGATVSSVTVDNHFDGGNAAIEGLRVGGVLRNLTGGLAVQGEANQSTLAATQFADVLNAGSWNETLYGGAGDDVYRFAPGFGSDTIVDVFSSGGGGGGVDRIEFSSAIAAGNVRLSRSGLFGDDLVINVVDANGARVSSVTIDSQFDGGNAVIESLRIGAASPIALTGGLAVQGVLGQTSVSATGFADRLISNVGNETLYGGGGNDVYQFVGRFGFDTIVDSTSTFGAGGIDGIAFAAILPERVKMSKAGTFSDDLIISIVDANGARVASVTIDSHFGGGNAVVESLRIGAGTPIALTGGLTVEGVRDQSGLIGTRFSDTLIGNAWNETLYGGTGNDIYSFRAGFGFDSIVEGQNDGGFDTLRFEANVDAGAIRLVRGVGFSSNDLFVGVVDAARQFVSRIELDDYFSGGNFKIERLALANGLAWSIDSLLAARFGTAGNDVIVGGVGNTLIDGLAGNDRITDVYGDNTLRGGLGSDVLVAGGGNDLILGGDGNDIVSAGAGVDRIIGGNGADALGGGLGRDFFDYNAITESGPLLRDRIADFRRGEDLIDLSTIDADIDGTAGNQAFTFIGSIAFTGVDGQLRFANGRLEGDVNGDRIADFAIDVTGIAALTRFDFVL
jgi:Ca2+-binding RTX toxin-like protein